MLTPLPIPDLFAVEVPHNTRLVLISTIHAGNDLVYYLPEQKGGHWVQCLPGDLGSWKFLFLSLSASEEDAKGVVDWFELAGLTGYRDYTAPDPRYPCTPLKSLNSALAAAGCDVTKNYAIVKKEK